jgi:hypothetical protein
MILGSVEELTLRPSAAIPASHRHARVAGLDRRCKSILAAESNTVRLRQKYIASLPHLYSSPHFGRIPFSVRPISHFIWFSRSAWHIGDFDLRITWGFTEGIDLVFTIAGLVCFYILRRHGPSLPAIRRRVTPPQNLIFCAFLPSL